MSSVINPNNNSLVVAGNLLVEDYLTVWKDVEIKGDLTVEDIDANDIISRKITNSNLIQTASLQVQLSTLLQGTTTIEGELIVNGVNSQTIGTPAEKIEFYYGQIMEVDELTVNTDAEIEKLTVNTSTETGELQVNNEFKSLGTSEVQGLRVNQELYVDGAVKFANQFEMLDAEYKKDFFDDPVAFTVFVKKDGDDNRTGRSEAGAVKTIKRGLEIAANYRRETESTILVSVGPGIYVEDGGLILPERCAMISKAGQYVTEIHMSDQGRKEYRNMILCNSGSYAQGFCYRNLEVDDFEDPSGGFAYALAPGALILRSPYVRDSSQVSNEPYNLIAPPLDPANGNPLVGKGGGMILADRSVVNQNSVYPGFLAFGATPRSPNGLGYVAKNGAFINGISSLTIFQRCSFYALNGGQLTLNNSGTQFGDISLRASGNIDVINPAQVSSTDLLVANVQLADTILANADVIVDALWDDLVENGPDRFGLPQGDPDYSPWIANTNFNQGKCVRDLGFIINAVKRDLLLGTNYNTITAGMSYQRANAAYVLTGQLSDTINSINYARDLINALPGITDTFTISSLFANVTNYITPTPPAYPLLSYPATLGASYQNTDRAAASAAIQANRASIISNLTTWLATSFPTFVYDVALCERDTGFILDAISHDVRYGGNIGATTSARAYFVGTESQLGVNEGETTANAYEYLKTLINAVVTTTPEEEVIDGLLDIILEVIREGSLNNLNPEIEIETDGLTLTEWSAISANATEVKSQTLDYINDTLNNSQMYDAAKCSRDTGLIIQAVAQDLVMDTNYNTLTAGMAYHRGTAGAQYVLNNQFEVTLDAIDEIAESVKNLDITTETKNYVTSLFENIYKTIRTGNLVHDIIYETPSLVNFKRDKCYRDVGFITQAVALDLMLGTNYNSVTAGLAYKRASSGYPFTRSDGYTPTDATYDPESGVFTATIGTHYFEVGDFITFKPEGVTFVCDIGYGPANDAAPKPGHPFYAKPCEITAKDETSITLNVGAANGYTGVHTFVSALDGAIQGDPGNGQTAQTAAALEYALQEIQALPIDAASNVAVANSFAEIIGTLRGDLSNVSTILYPAANAVDGETGIHVDAATALQDNRANLANATISFITVNYPDLEYSNVKCARDVGFLVDAITHDILYSGTYAMTRAAEAYFVDTDTTINPGEETLIGEGESEATIASFENLKTLINGYITIPEQQGDVALLLDIVINSLSEGKSRNIPQPVEPLSNVSISTQITSAQDRDTILNARGTIQAGTVNFVETSLAENLGLLPTPNADDARNLLIKHKEFILDTMIAFAESTYPTQMEDNALACRKDAGFIIDGMIHDILYGGNYATLTVANAYYNDDGTSVLPPSEIAATVGTWTYLNTVMKDTIQGIGVAATNNNYPYDLATATEAAVLDSLMGTVINYINDNTANPLPIKEVPSTAWVTPSRSRDYEAIIAAIPQIQASTIDYVNNIYANYYETKCKRDEKRLLEVLAFDLRAGTQMVTRSYSQGFFKYDGTLAIPEEQLIAYTHVYNKAIQLLQAEAGGAGTAEGIMIAELINIIDSTTTSPQLIQFGSLVESLAHQFNNAGAGVNQNALPLNFRHTGFNRPVQFSVLQENGGRVRWSGADELNNQYFAGGTKINGQTGKFEGRPFNISVRAIARRLANSRGGF